jgi:hypothetical protein
MEHLLEHWNLKKPHLVIAVAGGTEGRYFDVATHVRNAVNTSLQKMTTMSNAWVFTSALRGGVSKLAAEAVADSYHEDMSPVTCIGFCTWGSVANRKGLEDSNGRTVQYDLGIAFDDKEKCQLLDSSHTHFIMVDDGTQGQRLGHIELVSDLKKVLAAKVEGDYGITVPVVTLVIGGGQGTLKHIQETLKRNLPLVVVKDSGRLADVLVFAYDELMKRRNIFDCDLREPISGRVMAVFGDHYGKESIKNVVDGVVECMTALRKQVALNIRVT